MSKPPFRFSFIIACYNTELYIEACLQSLIEQDYAQQDFEIVCVDDGSTDRSSEIIQRMAAAHPSLFQVVRIPNSGLEKACNRGVSASRYDRIVRVDADDMLDRHFLRKMNQALTENPDCDFYYCQDYVEYYSPEKQIARHLPDFDAEEVFSRGDFFATGTVYKKEDLAAIGFFPEGIKNCGLENYNVVLALLTRGRKGKAVPGASFYYRRHATNMSTLKRQAIIVYGEKLLARYGRKFTTNQNHPYGLQLPQKDAV